MMSCQGDCLVSTDPPEPTASDDAETRVEDETLLWDERLPPIWSSDGRYGLLHRDLIWDRLGSYETGSRPTGVADPDEHFLLATIPANDADGLVTDDMDFDAIDPAFVESMGFVLTETDYHLKALDERKQFLASLPICLPPQQTSADRRSNDLLEKEITDLRQCCMESFGRFLSSL